MDSTLLNELISVNLRYSAVAKPLRTRAVAQAIAKVLYTVPPGQTVNVKTIAKDVGAVYEIDEISRKVIDDGLILLKEMGFGEKVGRNWKVSDRGRQMIEADLNRTRFLVDSIIERHFPKIIPTGKMREWLRAVCTAYFGIYGSYWASSICGTPSRSVPSPTAWHSIVPKTARENSLEEYSEALMAGFNSFLESNDSRDQEFMWCLGQAMFAARLISSTIGADPLTTKELKDSAVYLDTNILLMAQLEGGKHAHSIETLGSILEQLNIELKYLPITAAEYERVVMQTSEQTLRVVDRYAKSVIDNANDAFARTAQARGCSSKEDYEKFFEEIQQIPAIINGLSISLSDDEEIIEAAGVGEGDTQLKEKIADAWSSMRRSKKQPNAVTHDASLMYAIEDARAKGKQCWVLTTDKTMSWLSSQRASGVSKTSWIDLDTLLNIFALDLSGPTQGIESFGPLMSAVLKNEVQPMLGTYETQDLAWLLDIEERCADLSEEQTKKCVNIVTQARLSGKRADDPELQLDIQRAFQGERLELVSDFRMVKSDNEVLKAELESERASSKEYQDELIRERTRKFRRQAWISFTWKSLLGLIFGGGLIITGTVLANYSQSDSLIIRIGIPPLFIALSATVLLWIWKQIGILRKSLKVALHRAEQEVLSLGKKID